MDSNNWKPNQGSESTPDTIDWRTQLDPGARQRIVKKIMDTLKKHVPISGIEGVLELWKMAQKFEDRIYNAAPSQSDYLRKISIKMLTLETKSQSTIASNMTSNGGPSNNPPDQGLVLQSQVLNPGQQRSNPHLQFLPQTIQNDVAPQPDLPLVSTLSQTPSHNISLYSNIQQPGQSSASNSIGQNSNMQGMFPGYQRQMPGRQQVVPPQQQQLPQIQQIRYQHQQQVMKHMPSQMQQQQQQNLLQPNQLNTSQQSVMQTSSAIHQLSGNNVPGLQQQQLGTDAGNQGIQTSHHSAHMLQQPEFSMQPQLQHNASKSLPSQSQQSQPQASPQQLTSQIHSQLAEMQQQMGLQQQPSSLQKLQRDMQQNLQASGSLHQQQSVLDQQKQLYQSQRALLETSTTSVDSTTQTEQLSGGDWQEELYIKLQTMKQNYLPDLNEIFQKVAMRLQQYDSTPQQPKSDKVEKLRQYRILVERMITFLQIPKNIIMPSFKEKLGAYEKQIVSLINSFRPRKPVSSLQPGQLPSTHISSTPQSQSQVTSVQSHENQMIFQMQASNLQGSASTIQQNNSASLQHSSMPGLSTTQQNMLNSIQPSNNVDAGQGNSASSLQQVPLSSLPQNNVSTPQQTSINSLSSQGGVNVIQPNLNTHQSGSTMPQPQLKHQEHQMLQNQQYKQQYQQQGQLMQRQQIPQRLHQLSGYGQLQYITSGQNSGDSHHQLKPMNPFQVASPQLFQVASPQIQQHSSPQVEQQTQQQSLAKVATPLQSSNSPFVLPTPSPPMTPSPMLVDSENPVPSVSSSSAANVGQHIGGAAAPAQSLAIRTHGISATPLLAEFSGLDDAYFNAFTTTSGKDFGKEFGKELLKETRSKKIEKLKKEVESVTMKMKLLIPVLICFWVLFVLVYKSM